MAGIRSPYPTSGVLWQRGIAAPVSFVLVLALLAAFGAATPSVAEESSDPAAWRGGIAWEHVFVWDNTDEFTGNRHYGTELLRVRWDFIGDGTTIHPAGTQTAEVSWDRLETRETRTWNGTEYVRCTTVTSQSFEQTEPSSSANVLLSYSSDLGGWGGTGSFSVSGVFRTQTDSSGPSPCRNESHVDYREGDWSRTGNQSIRLQRLDAPLDAQKLSGVVSTSDATNNNVWRTTWNLARGDAEPDPWPDDNGGKEECKELSNGLDTCMLEAGDIILVGSVADWWAATFRGDWSHAAMVTGVAPAGPDEEFLRDVRIVEASPASVLGDGVQERSLHEAPWRGDPAMLVLRPNATAAQRALAAVNAEGYVGTPYQWTNPYCGITTTHCFYCSSLVWRAYRDAGFTLFDWPRRGPGPIVGPLDGPLGGISAVARPHITPADLNSGQAEVIWSAS